MRALTRNPESAAARKLADLGAQTVRADMGDVETMHAALLRPMAFMEPTDVDPAETRKILPTAKTVREWLTG